jgi:hypothetical protein
VKILRQSIIIIIIPETTQAVRQRRHMKWTDEIDIFIMLAYYRITKIEIGLASY